VPQSAVAQHAAVHAGGEITRQGGERRRGGVGTLE
jgi:hypothetical protein